MKKIFVLYMLIGLFLMSPSVFAWQDPCILQDYDFIMSEEYVLMNFTDDNTGFGPRPACGGEVTILCPDNRECVLPYDVWGETLIIGANMYDMNFKLIDDNRLVSQNDIEWEDVLARNGCPGEPVCDSEHLGLCGTQDTCEKVSGHWCSGVCQADECAPVCGSEHLNLCENQTACEIVGGHWYEDICNEEAAPDDNGTTPKPFICPLVGNTYQLDAPEISYSLSNFRCEVGPGCIGVCDLVYGNFDTGPMYIYPLPFSCQVNSIMIADLPCDIQNGNLRCLGVVMGDCNCYCIGDITYCFQEKKEVMIFEVD